MLYWCGIREGELLALTAADFNFDKETVTINKSYQRLHGEDVITSSKTKKSNRTIKMPKFLCEEMQEYIGMLYGLKKKDRIFTVTKSYLHHEMGRVAKAAGVKRIRIHDLRHPYVKPTTKNISLQKQNPKLPVDLIVQDFCFLKLYALNKVNIIVVSRNMPIWANKADYQENYDRRFPIFFTKTS